MSRGWRHALAGAVVACLTWPLVRPAELPGLDISWKAALQVAASMRLSFGEELLFTYGPLGFVLSPEMFSSKPGILALITLAGIWLTLATTLVVILGRHMHPLLAGVVALGALLLSSATGIASNLGSLVAIIVLLITLDALMRGLAWGWPASLGLGLFSAVMVLTKGDVALSIVAMLAIAVGGGAMLTEGRRTALRNVGVFGAGLLVGLPLTWVLARQPLGDLLDWLGGMGQIVRGYSAAMGQDDPAARWQYAAALVLVAALLTMVWTTRSRSVQLRVTATLLLFAGLYPLFRSGFTRQSPGRGSIFFLALLLVPIALMAVRAKRDVLLLMIAGAIAVLAASQAPLDRVLDVEARVNSFGDTVGLIASGSRRAEWIDEERATFSQTYAIPPEMLAEIGGRSAHVIPWETAVIFTYPGLNWDPLPVFQDYAAYTVDLDDRNSDVLSSARRPAFLLRHPGSIDGRLARFTPPRQNLELLCRYRVVQRTPAWELLRAGRDRCGQVRLRGQREVPLGRRISVPSSSDEIVVARFSGIGDSIEDRAETLLLRGPEYFIGSGTDDAFWRFLVGTQGSWHVLTAPDCAVPELVTTGPMLPTIALSDHRGPATGDQSYRVEFATIPLECPSSPR